MGKISKSFWIGRLQRLIPSRCNSLHGLLQILLIEKARCSSFVLFQMAPVFFCSCSNCNCTATVLSINPQSRSFTIPSSSISEQSKSSSTSYSFSTVSILPSENSKFVWREETHRIRTLVTAEDYNTEVKDENQFNLIETIFILALAASTAIGKKTLKP